MTVKPLLLLAPALMLAGCSMAPKTVLPAPPVPESWPVGDAYLKQSEAALPILSFKSVFTDPRLQNLVEQALANNRDLKVAYANVAAAKAQARISRAAQFPDLGVTGSAGISGTGSDSSGDFSVRGGVSAFELDLFGKRNKIEADATLADADKKTRLAEIDQQLASLK